MYKAILFIYPGGGQVGRQKEDLPQRPYRVRIKRDELFKLHPFHAEVLDQRGEHALYIYYKN